MPTPSHSYAFRSLQWVVPLIPVAIGVIVLVSLLHVGGFLNVLPEPMPADLEHTIVAGKVQLASDPEPAQVILMGDSSCMMDVDALQLGNHLGQPVLNLGTLSYVDLDAEGELLSRFTGTHPGMPRQVVVLMHPEALRQSGTPPEYGAYLRARLNKVSGLRQSQPRNSLDALLGCDIVRERILQPAIPTLLRGQFAVAYGSNWQILEHLHRSRGSLRDPASFDPAAERGSNEYRLATAMEAQSRAFRTRLPASTRLAVGITPVPASFASREHPAVVQAMLQSWSEWLRPDEILSGLPPILPDNHFATVTHLNAQGIVTFTELLGRELTREVRPGGAAKVPSGHPLFDLAP